MKRIPLAFALAGLSLACNAVAAPPAQELRDLQSVDELRAAFNADRGRPRLVLLLSPT